MKEGGLPSCPRRKFYIYKFYYKNSFGGFSSFITVGALTPYRQPQGLPTTPSPSFAQIVPVVLEEMWIEQTRTLIHVRTECHRDVAKF